MTYYLCHITQTTVTGYYTYDEAVVVAASEEEARHIHPDNCIKGWDETYQHWYGERLNGARYELGNSSWTTPDQVSVVRIGVADHIYTPGAVICASFNAAG